MAIKTSKQALAEYLQMDFAELKEYQYQPGRYTKPVYTCNESYYCATKGKAEPALSKWGKTDFIWREVPAEYVNTFGFKIWEATERESIGFFGN